MSKKTAKKRKDKGERERLRKKKEKQRKQDQAFILEKHEEQEEEFLSAMDEPDAEEIEKSYDEEVYYMGPTSFEELDAQRLAQEQAAKVNQVTYDVQDLVRNILHDPTTEATEKAGKLGNVASGFASRVESAVSAEPIKKDMDVLQIEAILGAYGREISIFEKGTNWLDDHLLKRKLSTAARNELKDSDFALPEKRKYPIHDKAHVRNALARAAQQIEKGGEAATDAKKALPKIRAAAKKFGIETAMRKSAILIEKDAKGDWRWIGRPSNNFIDHDGDIISKAAHQDYVDFLTKNPDMAPQFMTWHLPGTARKQKADGWLEHEGVLIMSGKLTEEEAARLLKAQANYDLGMSIAGLGAHDDPEDPRVVTKYRLYEVSDLPKNRAANPFTSLETMISKEVSMDDNEKIKYLSQVMGSSEEEAKDFLEKTGMSQQQLAEAGVTSKEKKDEGTETVDEPAVEETSPETLDVEELKKDLMEQVRKEFEIDGLNAVVAELQESRDRVELLEAMLKEANTSADDKLAEKLEPPAVRFAWSQKNKASASKENILDESNDEDKLLKQAAPNAEESWLSNLTHTTPVTE